MKLYGKKVINENGNESTTIVFKGEVVGEGVIDEENCKMAITPSCNPVIMFDNGLEVVFSWNELISMAYEFKNKEILEDKDGSVNHDDK